MKLNIENLKALMAETYNNNYHAFARAIGLDTAALYKILNNQINAGLKTINKLIEFLKMENLSVNKYIFLP